MFFLRTEYLLIAKKYAYKIKEDLFFLTSGHISRGHWNSAYYSADNKTTANNLQMLFGLETLGIKQLFYFS